MAIPENVALFCKRSLRVLPHLNTAGSEFLRLGPGNGPNFAKGEKHE